MTQVERNTHASFEVTSRALCFGGLHDILEGAAAPIQEPSSPRPVVSGTVKTQPMVHNVPAESGKWNVYALVNEKTSVIDAWFAAHEDVKDPARELTKILRVSGSPYEYESGSTMNTNETREEGVFVINRYDWVWVRDEDQFPNEAQEGDSDFLANGNSLGIVDYSHGASYVEDWIPRKPSQRGASAHGMWLYIPDGEYMFARFGFNQEYTRARSFLFFAARTDFFNIKFPGQERPLRKYETPLERFQRGLREGKDYSGIKELREKYEAYESTSSGSEGIYNLFGSIPPQSGQLGPYTVSDHTLKEDDIQALHLYRAPDAVFYHRRLPEFADEWKEATFDLINELVLSYLEHSVLPVFQLHHSNPTAAAPELFPKEGTIERLSPHSAPRPHVDTRLSAHFTQPGEDPVANLDIARVGSRIREFLIRRTDGANIDTSPGNLELEKFIIGTTRVVAFWVTEILYMANSNAIGGLQPDPTQAEEGGYIVPFCVRNAVYHDRELLALFRYSKVFWSGRQ